MENFEKVVRPVLLKHIKALQIFSDELTQFQKSNSQNGLKLIELEDPYIKNLLSTMINEFDTELLQEDLFQAYAEFHLSVKEILATESVNEIIVRCKESIKGKIFRLQLEYSKIKESVETRIRKFEYELICEEMIKILKNDLCLDKTDTKIYEMISDNLGGKKSIQNIKVTINNHILEYKEMSELLNKRKQAQKIKKSK